MFRTRLLQYNARGEPTYPEASLREKTWNFVSINVPEVMESLRASNRNRGGSIVLIPAQTRQVPVTERRVRCRSAGRTSAGRPSASEGTGLSAPFSTSQGHIASA